LICSLSFSQQEASQQPSQSVTKIAPAVSENRTALPPQELAKLTARTDLVLVPVIVTDKSGKHVSGLRKEAPPSAFKLDQPDRGAPKGVRKVYNCRVLEAT